MRASTVADRPGPDVLMGLDDVYAGESPAAVLDVPLRFVVPLAGPFGALLLLAMAWLSLP
ncbi:MAG TPA: hypothetical protein VFG69_07700 [Nannocystaceae bacterium]|nr:hypothetical protein [Nannocystaceae bacterium]